MCPLTHRYIKGLELGDERFFKRGGNEGHIV